MNEFPRKPTMGEACNGCGVCCVAEPCPMALDYVAGAVDGQPCPALEWGEGRSWCGLVRRPMHYGAPPLLAVVGLAMLGDGECDSGPAPWSRRTDDPADGLTALEYLHLRALGLEPRS